MNIVGVVNGYKEAKDIEEIVKVFIIERRVSNLLSKYTLENIDSNNIILSHQNVKNLEKPDININNKVENKIKPLFNVRGIN